MEEVVKSQGQLVTIIRWWRFSYFASSSVSSSGNCTGWCRLLGSQAKHNAPFQKTQGPGAVPYTPGVPQNHPVGRKNGNRISHRR